MVEQVFERFKAIKKQFASVVYMSGFHYKSKALTCFPILPFSVGIFLWFSRTIFTITWNHICGFWKQLHQRSEDYSMVSDDQWLVDCYDKYLSTTTTYYLMINFHGTYKPNRINKDISQLYHSGRGLFAFMAKLWK